MAEENLELGVSSGPSRSILRGPRYPFCPLVTTREIIQFAMMSKIRLRLPDVNIMQQVVVLIP